MTRPPAPLSSRGRPRYLQQCQQPLGPPRGPYREGRAAAPHRTLPRTVRPGLKCRLVHAPHSKFGTLVRDRKKGLKYRSDACRVWADRKLLLRAGAGSPIAPGASGPRGPARRAEGACRVSGMIVKQNPAPVGGGGGVRWGGRGGGGAREQTSWARSEGRSRRAQERHLGRKARGTVAPGRIQAGIRSALQPEGLRVLDKFLDSSQEQGRLATVHDAVIEAERHVHHRADDDLTAPRDGPLLDLVKA